MDDNLYIQFSRPLEPDEHVCLLRRGGSRRGYKSRQCAISRGENKMRPNRWVVYYQTSNGSPVENFQWPLEHNEQFNRKEVATTFEWDGGTSDDAYLIKDTPSGWSRLGRACFAWGSWFLSDRVARIYKGGNSKHYAPQLGAAQGITFGIGVYKAVKFKTKFGLRSLVKVKRISNVCYFRKFAKIEAGFTGSDLINETGNHYKLWTHIPK